MPKPIAPLTQLQVRNAKPRDKVYKLADGGGLYLEVTPKGSKLWRMKFRQHDGTGLALVCSQKYHLSTPGRNAIRRAS